MINTSALIHILSPHLHFKIYEIILSMLEWSVTPTFIKHRNEDINNILSWHRLIVRIQGI
jgi:hypothetical protein